MNPLIGHTIRQPTWAWHSKKHTGAFHGDIGIVSQIILCDPSYAPRLEPNLRPPSHPLNRGGALGPRSHPRSHHDPLPRPNLPRNSGLRSLPLQPLPGFPSVQTPVENAIQRGRLYIWQKGLLRQEPNLCHGAVGNALALGKGERRNHSLAGFRDVSVEYLKEEGSYEGGWYRMWTWTTTFEIKGHRDLD